MRLALGDVTEVSLTARTVTYSDPEGGTRTLSYDRLILAVWQTSFVGRHTLDVHVGSLRAKLDVPGLVQTVRGVGYRLRSDV